MDHCFFEVCLSALFWARCPSEQSQLIKILAQFGFGSRACIGKNVSSGVLSRLLPSSMKERVAVPIADSVGK